MPDRLPRAVVFDMDGLMLDTERLERDLWRAAAQRHGHDITGEFNARLVGRRAVEAEQMLLQHFGAAFPLAAIKADVKVHWNAIAAREGMPRKPGLEELLVLLERARIPKAVATSTVRAKALVSLGALADRFQALACGDEVVDGKPAPDIYLLAARRLGIDPQDALALEDSLPGVAAARAAHMPVIMIPDLVAPADPPEFLCASLAQVAQWLQSCSAAAR
jgi:beta-phosphoglucomutase-like phosphatase (HAD superfamily)